MAWRLARSLVTLNGEVRQLFPGTTIWDIGDPDHAATDSDHNPNECCDVVCATDTLGDGGMSLAWFAEKVREAGLAGHPAPKYVIYNRRIASRSQGWVWRTYSGSNPHTGHVHTSVGVGPDGRSTGPYDDTSPWGLLEDEDMACVEIGDTVKMTDGNGDRYSYGRSAGQDATTVNGALGAARGAFYHLERRVVPSLARVEAQLAVIAGQDPATAVRNEIAKLTSSLVEAVNEAVPEANQATIEAALRTVLGSVDEG